MKSKRRKFRMVIGARKYRLQIKLTFYGILFCGICWVIFSPLPIPALLNHSPEFITSMLSMNKYSFDGEISNVFMSAFVAFATLLITYLLESISEIKLRDSKARMKHKERILVNKKRVAARKRSMTDSIVKIQEYFCTIFEAIDSDGQIKAQNKRDERGSISFLKERSQKKLQVLIYRNQDSKYWCSPSLFYECLSRTESYILWISNYRFIRRDDDDIDIDTYQHYLKYTALRALKSLRDGLDKYQDNYHYPVDIKDLLNKTDGVNSPFATGKRILNVKEAIDFVLDQKELNNKSDDCDNVRKLIDHLYLAIEICIRLSLAIVKEMERKDLELFNRLEEENRMNVWGIV